MRIAVRRAGSGSTKELDINSTCMHEPSSDLSPQRLPSRSSVRNENYLHSGENAEHSFECALVTVPISGPRGVTLVTTKIDVFGR